jgi:eukaryotic-like serine/threonine-protein kinase
VSNDGEAIKRERPRDIRVGQLLNGTYRILSVLDEGGMGKLYRAEHQRLRRPVAVKVLTRGLSANEEALKRFRREAEIVSQLAHPHIVHILDFDTTEVGEPYIVMELLSGKPLSRYLDEVRILPLRETVEIVTQIAAALTVAHRAGVVHRDLKPDNVFMLAMRDGSIFIKLLDFGISRGNEGSTRFTGKYDILGTPEYMSPEQALETAKADHRADQWSLACITYEMLTGRVPFTGESAVKLLANIVSEPAPPLTQFVEALPVEIQNVVLRGLAKNREQRFATINEYAENLVNAAQTLIASESTPNLLHAPKPAHSATAPTIGVEPHKRTTKPVGPAAPGNQANQRSSGTPCAEPVPAPVLPLDALMQRGKPAHARLRSALSPVADESAHFESGRIRKRLAATPPPKVQPPTRPNLGNLPALAATKDVDSRSLATLVDDIKKALSQGNQESALQSARAALRWIRGELDGPPQHLATEALSLMAPIFLQALGGKHKRVCMSRIPSNSYGSLHSSHMFLVSRIEGPTTIEELLDISPLSEAETLGILLDFSDQSMLTVD